MATVTIHEAKTNLSKLIARAEAGEEIIIARGKQPVAKLTSLAGGKGRHSVFIPGWGTRAVTQKVEIS